MTVVTVSKPHPIFLAGRWVESPDVLVVDNPADPETPAGATFTATEAQYEEAVEAAVAAFEVTRKLPAYERGGSCARSAPAPGPARGARAVASRPKAGKPIRDALVEVDRATLTFRLGAEEAERMTGELIPLDLLPSSKDRIGITRRFPDRPDRRRSARSTSRSTWPPTSSPRRSRRATRSCSSRRPRTRSRCSRWPRSSRRPGAPAGSVSILPMTRELGDRMVADERFKLLTFTGSPSVGWRMKERAGKKKVVLELGGNAGVIVDSGRRPRLGRQALPGRGVQLCRPGLHQRPADGRPRGRLGRVHGPVRGRARAALKLGDPLDPTTDLGPMVDATAGRTQRWVDEAVALGGKLLLGGKADGTFFPPTVLTDVPLSAQVCSNEAFAPLVVAFPFHELDDAIARVNDSMFGLQTGVFTNDLAGAWQAFAELEVGGVIVNDVPTYRIDHMPYGGVKDSGLGREGMRWAIEDMTEIRIMVLAQPAQHPRPGAARDVEPRERRRPSSRWGILVDDFTTQCQLARAPGASAPQQGSFAT